MKVTLMTKKALILFALVFLAAACLPEMGPGESESTERFRAGLVGEADIKMNLQPAHGAHHLSAGHMNAGEKAGLPFGAAEAVVGTNLFLLEFVVLMQAITSLPPTIAEEDHHIWEGTHENLFLRVTVEREELDGEGTRYDFRFEGREQAAAEEEMLTVFDGYAVRPEGYQFGQGQGYGIVRHNFDHLNTLEPWREVGGTTGVSFRRMGGVHQVDVRAIDIVSPENPDFPERAAYRYVQHADNSGELLWTAVADWKQDGAPLEDIAAQVRWNADLSGVGVGRVSGGSLEVDYVYVAECWNNAFDRLYGELSSPGVDWHSGDDAYCAPEHPDMLFVPTPAELPGDEPAVPGAHPDEA